MAALVDRYRLWVSSVVGRYDGVAMSRGAEDDIDDWDRKGHGAKDADAANGEEDEDAVDGEEDEDAGNGVLCSSVEVSSFVVWGGGQFMADLQSKTYKIY